MKFAALLVLSMAAVSSAFAPSMARRSTVSMAAASKTGYQADGSVAGIPAGATGATVEVGKPKGGWDPLKLASYRDFDELRACEIKNGRVAMLATTGWVWPQMFGLYASDDVTTVDPIKAIGQVDPAGWAQILVLIGCFESLEYKHKMSGSTEPFFDPFNQVPSDPAKAAAKQESELKNGRLAMIAFASYLSAYYIPGSVPALPAGWSH